MQEAKIPTLCIGNLPPPPYEYHAPSRAYLRLGQPAAASSDNAVAHAHKFYYVLPTGGGGAAVPRRLGPVAEGGNYPFPSACVAIRGTLYWSHHPEDGGSSDVVVFDTVSEAFRLIPSPPPLAEHHLRTFEMDGRLDVCNNPKIWIQIKKFPYTWTPPVIHPPPIFLCCTSQ